MVAVALPSRGHPALALARALERGLVEALEDAVTAPGGAHIALALQRGKEGFSEKERAVLDLIRPHLVNAYRNARTHAELKALEQALETEGTDVVIVDGAGEIAHGSERALKRVAGHFGSASGGAGLPDALQELVAPNGTATGNAPRPKELVVDRDDRRVVARALPARGSNRGMLMLSERRVDLTTKSLEPLGLTRRETEIAVWVVRGKTNTEIAETLYVSPRTVKRHLEKIYDKVGVRTRTELTALAFRAAS